MIYRRRISRLSRPHRLTHNRCMFTGAYLLSILLLAGCQITQALPQWSCRMDPDATQTYCGLPYALSNFQGNYPCNTSVLVGRPKTVEELSSIVTSFQRVRAVGVGHSWRQDTFCAGDDERSVNLVITDLDAVLPSILRTQRTQQRTVEYPIQVNLQRQTVRVAGGVSQRMLLDYLASYPEGNNGGGWTLPAFSWFIDQTVAGAVATATHGSSLRYGSLSSQLVHSSPAVQVVALEVMLANGSLVEYTRHRTPAYLWNALEVSVGRLGIIMTVTFNIIPQKAVQRTTTELSFQALTSLLQDLSSALMETLTNGSAASVDEVLLPLDRMQLFWFPPLDRVWMVEYAAVDVEPLHAVVNEGPQPKVQGFSGPQDVEAPEVARGVYRQLQKQPLQASTAIQNNVDASFWSQLYAATLEPAVANGTFASRNSYLSMTEAGSVTTATSVPYDQYEVAVPLHLAGQCFEQLSQEVYGPRKLWQGFRTPPLIRFTSGEQGHLSPSHGSPHMYVNLEDYVSRSTGAVNQEFMAVMKVLRGPACQGRLHWGKAGWPTLAPCWDGAAEYPKTWCHFGCAVQVLDPSSKFVSQSDVWEWRALRGNLEPIGFGRLHYSTSLAASD